MQQTYKLASDATTAAQSDRRLVGVLPSWITTLINLLIPGISTLFPCIPAPTSAQQARDDLESAYDEQREQFSPVPVHTMAIRARRLSRREGNPLTLDQSLAIAEHTLDTARTADDPTLNEAMGFSSPSTAEAPTFHMPVQP